MLARYYANNIVPLEWVFNLPFVSVSWLFLIDFDLLWNGYICGLGVFFSENGFSYAYMSFFFFKVCMHQSIINM
jgi:hypothetical protein